MTKNTFHGDPRPSLWRWNIPVNRFHVDGHASSIAPSDKDNERVSCYCQKTKSLVLAS